jgi:hypothetical protein
LVFCGNFPIATLQGCNLETLPLSRGFNLETLPLSEGNNLESLPVSQHHCKRILGPKSSQDLNRRALYSYSWISIRGILILIFSGNISG